jgi:hypothetical protein
MTSALAAAAWVPLAEEPAKTGAVGPGLVAVAVVGLLVVATVLLIRSMLTHINRVPPTFDNPPPAGGPEGRRDGGSPGEPGDASGPAEPDAD